MKAALRVGVLLVLLMASLAWAASSARRAAADNPPPPGFLAGTGNLQGTELVDDGAFTGAICIKETKSIFGLRGAGTVYGETATGQEVVYNAQINNSTQTLYGDGPLQVQVENTQTYYHGPGGTAGTNDPTCSTGNQPIPAAFRIFAAGNVYRLDGSGNQVPCPGTGTFARGPDGAQPNWQAQWTLDADCTVVGNAAGTPGTAVSPAGTTFTDSGAHDPCFAPPCVNNIRVDYKQYLPLIGFHVTLSGPSSTPVGSTEAVTATVTNNGLAVADAAVSFSVAGPGPGAPPSGGALSDATGRATFTFTAAAAGDYTVTATASSASLPTTTVPATTVPSTTVPSTTVAPTTVAPTTIPVTTVPPTTVPPTTVPPTTVPPTTVPPTTVPGSQTATGTLAVTFTPLPPPAIALSGPAGGQTEENQTVTATFSDAGHPVPGSTVNFSVTATAVITRPGQPSPASGSATTDRNGQAAFSFSGNRTGDYTVAASTTVAPGQAATATFSEHLDINTFKLVGATTLPDNNNGYTGSRESVTGGAVVDPAGRYAYFGAQPGIVKVDLATFSQVATLTLPPGLGSVVSAVMDRAGRYAYFGTDFSPGQVVKVDLSSFTVVGAITLDPGEVNLTTAVIDPAGAYAYFGTKDDSGDPSLNPGRVVKIDLATFQPVGAITFPSGQNQVQSAVMDPAGRYAYFGAAGAGSGPGTVVKVALGSFQEVGGVTMNGTEEQQLTSGVIDPGGHYAYFGSGTSPGKVVKVDLGTLQRVGAITLGPGERFLDTAVIDPAGRYAYFGTNLRGSATNETVVKIDLSTFQRAYGIALPAADEGLLSAVIDPAGGFVYFGSFGQTQASPSFPTGSPSAIVKIAVSRPPVPWLAAANDSYATPYGTALSVAAPGVLANDSDTHAADPLAAGQPSQPAHGTVALNADGSFTYTPNAGFSSTDSFTYTASDGTDYSAPATVSVTVAPPPQGVQSANASAFGFYTNVGLFGGAPSVHGGPGSNCEQAGQPACNPGQSVAVATPAGGGDVSATDPDGNVGSYGPAYIFENHGALTVHATGSTGPTGSVSASASVADISDNDPFHAGGADGEVSSTCTATLSGLSGSAHIVNGRLVTSNDVATANAATEIDFAHIWDPGANTVYSGRLNSVGDSWRMVFNEQILGPDSITVNAVHLYLLGPTAIGDMIIGQSHCALTQAAAATAPTAAADSYTATAGQALAVAAPGVLANDTDGDGGPLSAATLAPTPPPATGGGAWTFPSNPAHGTVSLGADGSFTYTANAGYSGADTFTYQAQDARGATSAPTTVTITVNAGVSHAVADFAGDGVTDLSVFRPSAGQWLIADGTTSSLGLSGDLAVPCDYGGGGVTQTAVYRPSTGGWYIAGQDPQFFGLPGDVPVPGHYGGDSNCDLAVFRPSTGAWYIQGQPTQYLGLQGDIPVPAAYRGGNVTLPAVFRPSTGAWYIAGPAAGSVELAYYGLSGDIPVPADYNGTGTATIAVYRASAGAWYIQNQATQYLGLPGDIPVPGTYSAGGATIAVFRPSSGGWYINGQATQYYGLNGDQPLPLPGAVVHTFFP